MPGGGQLYFTLLTVVIAVPILLMAALGLMMTPLLTEALAVLPNTLYSHGSAIMATLQQVAGAAGTAAFVTVAAVTSHGPAGAPDATGLQAGFAGAGVIGLLVVVTALFVRGKPAPRCEPRRARRGRGQRHTGTGRRALTHTWAYPYAGPRRDTPRVMTGQHRRSD